VKILVGFTPGTAPDLAARILADRFSEVWGTPFVVENVPGAGSNIVTDRVAKAAADGYTPLMVGHVCALPHLRSNGSSQSNRLDTDSSDAVRLIASAISGAIDRVRMLAALVSASVGRIESVMTSSFSREPAIRAAAPPDSTPWEM
jgi:hypothetical protein